MEDVVNRVALESISMPPKFVKITDLFEVEGDGKSVCVGTLYRGPDGTYVDKSELPSNAKLVSI